MDYTTTTRLKQEIHILSGSSVDDALLGLCVTSASRLWDRMCTGSSEAINYFMTEDVVNEVLEGQSNYAGDCIICSPHKPVVNSVASFSYQERIIDPIYSIDVSRIDISGYTLKAYPSGMPINFPGRCRITISYNGGITSGSSITSLPDDMQEAVTVLAARLYREAETGLTDQIGVAELATLVYTKAIPVRVQELLQYYKRRAGWRHVA